MSGGSLNYLSYKDEPNDFFGADFEYAVEKLMEENSEVSEEAKAFAQNMLDMQEEYLAFNEKFQAFRQKSEKVLHGLEWSLNNDWGPEEYRQALKEWRA